MMNASRRSFLERVPGMRVRTCLMSVLLACACAAVPSQAARVDVPAQCFRAGGWSLDAQFMDVMGSPYLLAHGLGVPVEDATAEANVAETGTYRVWVHTRNWADGAPGRFTVLVNGHALDKTFGTGASEWTWEDGGVVELSAGIATVALHDLTGFDGRCAGVVLDADATSRVPPVGAITCDAAKVVESVDADFVVVGGGLPGTCAAVAAARRGLKTVLVQDRPVLGGNASAEIRVWCAGEARYDLVRELRGTFMNRAAASVRSDARRMRIVRETPNLEVRLSTRAFGVEKRADGGIAAVKALDLARNQVVRFAAPLFADATGDGWVGFWAGADFRMGREAKHEHDESFAPEAADGDTLGASLMWTSADGNAPVPFAAPWAEPFAQGEEAVNGEWNWEYGIHRDMIEEGEAIRDRLLLAIYGAFSRAKKRKAHANRVLDFCPFLLGKRESRRLMGDWVLSEKDVTEKRLFPDAIATGSWSVDLHYDDCKKGVDFLTTCRQPHYGRYWIPYRAIYSRNVPNLFMAGRCFSCTHVGLASPRVICTLAQLGVAAGEAAALCKENACGPRGVWEKMLVRELQDRLGGDWPDRPAPERADWAIVDDETPGVLLGKGWNRAWCPNGEQVGDWTHVPGARGGGSGDKAKLALAKTEPAVYPLPVKKAGRYALHFKVPYSWWAKPGSSTALDVVSGGVTVRATIDQGYATGTWQKVGEFDLAPGATLAVVPAASRGTVFADGFALAPVK